MILHPEPFELAVELEPVGESCVDVDPKKHFDVRTVFPKNPTSREERELENCGHPVHKNWRGAFVKDRYVGTVQLVEL